MSVNSYYEFRFWSPILGCEAARISVPDARGNEHFAIIPADRPGKTLRDDRRRALDAIDAHISNGKLPGEVPLPQADDL